MSTQDDTLVEDEPPLTATVSLKSATTMPFPTTSTCRPTGLLKALEAGTPSTWVVERDGARGLPECRRVPAHRRGRGPPPGWAKFGYVKMPEYRWGILLAPKGGRPHHSLWPPQRASPRQEVPANTAPCCAA